MLISYFNRQNGPIFHKTRTLAMHAIIPMTKSIVVTFNAILGKPFSVFGSLGKRNSAPINNAKNINGAAA